MESPLVSIFIPTYNCEVFIKECLDSVLAQNYPNMEIVISDDASTDNTAIILREYKAKHPDKIKLNINLNNLGITKNCNVALSMCTGKYIAFFAGDDVMLPGKIQKQVNYMENNLNCTICYHNVEVFFCKNDTQNSLYLHHHAVKPREGDVSVIIKYGPFSAGCSNMVRSEKISPQGFDERLLMVSDGLFWIEALENGGEINYIDEVLARYRLHTHNNSTSKYSERALDFLVHQSKLLIKYPEYASHILSNYSDALFLIAKASPKSIHYLKASFRVRKSIKVLTFIIFHYISLGTLSLNSKYMRYINSLFVKTRVQFNKFLQRYFVV